MKSCLVASKFVARVMLAAPVMFLALGAITQAQAPPTPDTSSSPSFGFSLPSVEGTMTYSLSGSQSFYTGYNGSGVNRTTALSGSLGYLSSSPDKPFSLVYSGGYLYSSVPGYPGSSTFQNLAASQVVTTKNWNFVIDDAVSYMPEAPTTGLSGIPGVGDIGVTPVQIGDQPTQSILTNYATRVGNGLNGGATRKINASLSINGSASWQILRFTGDEGIDSDTETGSVGPTYRIDARSSASANAVYTYTKDTYAGADYPFTSEGVTFQYQRQLTRFLSMTVAGGPQRTAGSGATEALIPSQITGVGNAGADLCAEDDECERLVCARYQQRLGRGVWSADGYGERSRIEAAEPQLADGADGVVLEEHGAGEGSWVRRGLCCDVWRRSGFAEAGTPAIGVLQLYGCNAEHK